MRQTNATQIGICCADTKIPLIRLQTDFLFECVKPRHEKIDFVKTVTA